MDIQATLETRTNKEGRSYKCVVIKLSDHSEKLVFLSPAELELLEIHNKDKQKYQFNMPELD